MIPILYDHSEKDFTSEGVGRLAECVSCRVTEEVNGEYECEFEYPVSGEHFQRLVNYGGIIAATHDHGGDAQPFDIYAYEAPIEGVVTFHAHHVSYRLSNLIVGGTNANPAGLAGATPAQVFDQIPAKARTPVEFTFKDFSDYIAQPGRNFGCGGYASVRDAFFSKFRRSDSTTNTKALVEVFPGEFVFDRFDVFFYQRRGSNRGVQIRYGKNMEAVTREHAEGDLISAVFPYWIGQPAEGVPSPPVVLGGEVVSPHCAVNLAPWEYALNGYSMEVTPGSEPYYFGAADIRAAAVNFSSQFAEQPTVAQLEQAALDWMEANASWKPYDNITVSFIDLYGELGDLERCAVGDLVDVYHSALGIVVQDVEIVRGVYNTLVERFEEMELGDAKISYAQTIIETMQGGIKA